MSITQMSAAYGGQGWGSVDHSLRRSPAYVGPSFGPYSRTKHALEAMGKAMRVRTRAPGNRRHLLNRALTSTVVQRPEAASLWDGFGDDRAQRGGTPMSRLMRGSSPRKTDGPAEVVTRMVELTEATTTEHNFVAPDVSAAMADPRRLTRPRACSFPVDCGYTPGGPPQRWTAMMACQDCASCGGSRHRSVDATVPCAARRECGAPVGSMSRVQISGAMSTHRGDAPTRRSRVTVPLRCSKRLSSLDGHLGVDLRNRAITCGVTATC